MTITTTSAGTTRRASAVRISLAGKPITAAKLLELMEKRPREVAEKVSNDHLAIHADRDVLDALQSGPLGGYVEDDGTVTASAMGLAGAFVAGLVIGFVVGVAVGVALSGDESETESEDSGTGDSGSGDSGDSGDSGGSGGSGG